MALTNAERQAALKARREEMARFLAEQNTAHHARCRAGTGARPSAEQRAVPCRRPGADLSVTMLKNSSPR